jgi:hypothetical protein
MGVEIGQILLGEFYQSLSQIQRSSCQLAGKPVRLPFMLSGKKAQSWCQREHQQGAKKTKYD